MAHSVQETQRQLIACALEVLADAASPSLVQARSVNTG
ncbi:hypothetical protein HMPREF1136_0016 [Actinomyces sp. ICM47]|nr:hypothetical protein HMPREF1136_0016 [Actinomyces sp. ICM47]